LNKAILFSILTLAIMGLFLSQQAQAGNGGTPPLCPPGTILTGGTDTNGVPLCAANAVDFCPSPLDTSIDNIGNCQPQSDEPPLCPAGTTQNLTNDMCEGPSTCPPGTTLNPTSLLCELTIVTPVVGGTIIPIETTSLLLAGAQSTTWLIPVALSIIGIGVFVVSRKSENS
jgi:hypothetical protein